MIDTLLICSAISRKHATAPFLDAGYLSRPFERADATIKLAASHGIFVLLDPIKTSNWLPALRAAGMLFVGLDVIGGYVTEINVTSPTGARELERQFGINVADQLMGAIARR